MESAARIPDRDEYEEFMAAERLRPKGEREAEPVTEQTAREDRDRLRKAASITVAGRTFHPCADTTFRQDAYVMKLLAEAGLENIGAQLSASERIDDVTRHIILRAFGSGQLFNILGAVFEEDATIWSVETARANGEFFATLRATADKEALRGSIVAVLLSFFVNGMLSSQTFQNSIRVAPKTTTETPETTTHPERKPETSSPAIAPDRAADSTSASGAASSASSLSTTSVGTT